MMEDHKDRQTAAADEATRKRRQKVIAEVTAAFDGHLAQLRAPDTCEKMEAVMKARGRTRTRPKAGSTF